MSNQTSPYTVYEKSSLVDGRRNYSLLTMGRQWKDSKLYQSDVTVWPATRPETMPLETFPYFASTAMPSTKSKDTKTWYKTLCYSTSLTTTITSLELVKPEPIR